MLFLSDNNREYQKEAAKMRVLQQYFSVSESKKAHRVYRLTFMYFTHIYLQFSVSIIEFESQSAEKSPLHLSRGDG